MDEKDETNGKNEKEGKNGRAPVLIPAGKTRLTRQALERKCSARLADLLAKTTLWRSEGEAGGWRVGDFRFLIVETRIAPDALVYVQFWSEPEQPVLWEVSSGHLSAGVRRFVTRDVRRLLGEMDFRIRGSARNFSRTITISNEDAAAAVARDVLDIFHAAFGYRGQAALVANACASSRSEQAVVHTGLTPRDLVALLEQFGYSARLAARRPRPVVAAKAGGFNFAVVLDSPAGCGTYRTLDLTAIVGRITNATTLDWVAALNELNSGSRVARGWIDGRGHATVGTSFCLTGGLTATFLADQIGGWRHAAEQLVGGPDATDEDGAPPEDEANGRRVKHVLH